MKKRKLTRKKAKLPPHQYSLRLNNPSLVPKPIAQAKPHLVWCGDHWALFKSRWKSQFRGPKLWAAAINGLTIREVQHRLRRSKDGRYGYYQLK